MPFLPAALRRRDLVVTADILDDSGEAVAPVTLTKDAAVAALRQIWKGVAADGFDLSVLKASFASQQAERRTCLAFADMFSRLSGLPPDQAGPLMRCLLGAKG